MNRFKPHLALLACNILWALDFPFYSVVLSRYVHPLALVTASLAVAALLSLVPLLWQKPERVARADVRKLVGAALLIGILRKLFLMYGLSKTSPIDGSIINTISPLLVLALSVALGVDRFTKEKAVGLTLGLLGAIGVVLSGGTQAHEHAQFGGNVLIVLAACATAFYMVLLKPVVARYKPVTVLRWIYCTAAVAVLPFGLASVVEVDFASVAQHVLWPTLFVLLVPTYAPNLLLNYALRSVPSTVTSIYTYLQPVLAIAVSVAMGLDRLHVDTAVFALVIFVGVGLVLRAYAGRGRAAVHKA